MCTLIYAYSWIHSLSKYTPFGSVRKRRQSTRALERLFGVCSTFLQKLWQIKRPVCSFKLKLWLSSICCCCSLCYLVVVVLSLLFCSLLWNNSLGALNVNKCIRAKQIKCICATCAYKVCTLTKITILLTEFVAHWSIIWALFVHLSIGMSCLISSCLAWSFFSHSLTSNFPHFHAVVNCHELFKGCMMLNFTTQ